MSDLIEALYNTCEGDEESIMYQAADLIEQLQARVVELESDRDALAAHVERLRSIAFPYISLLPELVDWFDDTPTTTLAERDAEVARKAFIAGAIWHVGLSIHDDRPHGENAFKKPANEYAERVKRGEV